TARGVAGGLGGPRRWGRSGPPAVGAAGTGRHNLPSPFPGTTYRRVTQLAQKPHPAVHHKASFDREVRRVTHHSARPPAAWLGAPTMPSPRGSPTPAAPRPPTPPAAASRRRRPRAPAPPPLVASAGGSATPERGCPATSPGDDALPGSACLPAPDAGAARRCRPVAPAPPLPSRGLRRWRCPGRPATRRGARRPPLSAPRPA